MSDTKVTRIRIEVSGREQIDVEAMLVESVQANRDEQGGEWEIEDPGVEVLSAKEGYWGRVTIRRKDAQGDHLLQR